MTRIYVPSGAYLQGSGLPGSLLCRSEGARDGAFNILDVQTVLANVHDVPLGIILDIPEKTSHGHEDNLSSQ
jgi:hypothetical protein